MWWRSALVTNAPTRLILQSRAAARMQGSIGGYSYLSTRYHEGAMPKSQGYGRIQKRGNLNENLQLSHHSAFRNGEDQGKGESVKNPVHRQAD